LRITPLYPRRKLYRSGQILYVDSYSSCLGASLVRQKEYKRRWGKKATAGKEGWGKTFFSG
jgi:hypothetical protein